MRKTRAYINKKLLLVLIRSLRKNEKFISFVCIKMYNIVLLCKVYYQIFKKGTYLAQKGLSSYFFLKYINIFFIASSIVCEK